MHARVRAHNELINIGMLLLNFNQCFTRPAIDSEPIPEISVEARVCPFTGHNETRRFGIFHQLVFN